MEIKEKLIKLIENSYSPYSKFSVAAIVIDDKGNEYYGVNVESATFGATICAERNAINSAITKGMKKGELREVHLIAKTKIGNYIPASPCGICRQVIAEISNRKARVFRYDETGIVIQSDIESLLPDSFIGDVL